MTPNPAPAYRIELAAGLVVYIPVKQHAEGNRA